MRHAKNKMKATSFEDNLGEVVTAVVFVVAVAVVVVVVAVVFVVDVVFVVVVVAVVVVAVVVVVGMTSAKKKNPLLILFQDR